MILLVIQCNVGMFILFKNRKISFNEKILWNKLLQKLLDVKKYINTKYLKK